VQQSSGKAKALSFFCFTKERSECSEGERSEISSTWIPHTLSRTERSEKNELRDIGENNVVVPERLSKMCKYRGEGIS
jgi:hypothetical protein